MTTSKGRTTLQKASLQVDLEALGSGSLQRKCSCGNHTVAGGECDACRQKREGTLQRAAANHSPTNAVPPIVHEVLRSPGQPLDASTRAFMEPRFGQDFSGVKVSATPRMPQFQMHIHPPGDLWEQKADRMADSVLRGQKVVGQTEQQPTQASDFRQVRVHTDTKAAESAQALHAAAYTVGNQIVFGDGQYNPQSTEGRKLLAHELTHVVQQGQMGSLSLQRYGDPIPRVEKPTVKTMKEFIDLVKRVEAANAGKRTLEIAQMIMRTKYHSMGFNFLLPSSKDVSGVTATGKVSADDVATLTGDMEIELPEGGKSDPSHIITAIVAGAESQAPGKGQWVKSILVQSPPSGLSQRDIASWVGDIALGAAKWHLIFPAENGGSTKEDYLNTEAPEWDLIADIDGVVMTSRDSTKGFAFDVNSPLSSNLENFYFPKGSREGKNRRFHSFCAVEGFALAPDGVTLSPSAINAINNRVQLATGWFETNTPELLLQLNIITNPPTMPTTPGIMSQPSLFPSPLFQEWQRRHNDWQWFAKKFQAFVQRNLKAEGP